MLSLPMTWVREGGMVQLSKKYLKAEYKGSSDAEILYTITTPDGTPKHGRGAQPAAFNWNRNGGKIYHICQIAAR